MRRLLPRLRGAAPIQWAIADGDTETGVTIMQMEAGIDSGPMLHRVTTPIGPDETGGELTERLARLGAGALVETLDRLARGELVPWPRIPPSPRRRPRSAARPPGSTGGGRPPEVARRIRAFDPAPGAWTSFGALELKCFRPTVVPALGPPGDAAPRQWGAGGGGRRGGRPHRGGAARGTNPAGGPEWLRGHPMPAETRLG